MSDPTRQALVDAVSPAVQFISTDPDEVADAVIAAGWRPPPRVITTPEERAGLAATAVIRDANGAVFEVDEDRKTVWATLPWTGFGKDFGYELDLVTLPAVVLYEPEATS